MGFMGLYALLAILFLFLVRRTIERGPVEEAGAEIESGTPVTAV
jgi:cytochrome bd-type quinol oxidase subunit 1